MSLPRSFVPLWTAGSQFPGLPRQQVLDKLEVSGRVSTFPRGGGSSIWVYTRCCETSGWRADCASVFFSHLCFLQKDLPHQASQGSVPVVSWPFSELGYLEGSFRDEASFLAFRRLFNFWTRHPGTAEGVLCAVLLALWFCASTSTLLQEGPGSPALFMQAASETTPLPKGRVDCHRLRQNQCDRVPPSLLKAFCAALLLSCQRLGTSQTRERMGATLRLALRQHPPNADKAQIGAPWTQVQKSRPTSSVPTRCLPWYGSTSHLGTVAKRTRLMCYGCRATTTAFQLCSLLSGY